VKVDELQNPQDCDTVASNKKSTFSFTQNLISSVKPWHFLRHSLFPDASSCGRRDFEQGQKWAFQAASGFFQATW